MICDSDRASLPAGVLLEPDGLRDDVRRAGWPLNETARFVVATADHRSLGEVAQAVSERFGISRACALADVRAFACELNAKLLLNLEPRWGSVVWVVRWTVLAIRLLPLGVVPRFPRRRRPLDSETVPRALATVARGLAGEAAAVALLAAGAAALLLAGLGAGQIEGPLVLGSCAGLGLVLHEAGHAASLRGIPCCLGTSGLRAFVLHPALPSRRRALAAAAGPGAVLAAGSLALVPATVFSLDQLALGASLLAAQALGLTVAGRDGRRACGLS